MIRILTTQSESMNFKGRRNKVFKCPGCGCVFEADENEYFHAFDINTFVDRYLVEKCPKCGDRVCLSIQR